MAKIASVWGLEIGQSALKALKCRLDGETLVAEAFDYIEYPKILSQPEAEPETLVREALETFIGRNDLKKCKVGLSVPGQSGLAKFFKPPPVEVKKIPDIVKYEAKQQIPFDLNDVIWDYQQMAGGSVEDGFALETEVGLFAMKRDAVYRALKPLLAQGIEIDLIQLAPLSIYNMITYDRLVDPEAGEVFDPDHPPKSTVVLAMGTDATDLIITNGFRVWQRNMPLGGNHFTRQLTKDLKLTFAKAEHLKRNAMEAEDPKLVFQAMRPVFTDMVNEVQRSVGFFRSLNKKAELSSIVMLGNTTKLPGLSNYLNKNLGMDVEIMDRFQKLTGDDVLTAPAFKDHQAAFGPVYGLCLQLLGQGPMHTNLVPKEILKQRLIRAKKPWVVATAAALMLGFVVNLLFANGRTEYVSEAKWGDAIKKAEATQSESKSEKDTDGAKLSTVQLLTKVGQEVSGNADRRILWLELLHSVFKALERPEGMDGVGLPSPKDVPYYKRTDIHFTRWDCKYYDDLSTWYTEQVASAYEEDKRTRLDRLGLTETVTPADGTGEVAAEGGEVAAADAGAEATDAAAVADTASTDTASTDTGADGEGGGAGGLSGPGWVIQLNGYHYHNEPPDTVKERDFNYRTTFDEEEDFVLKRLIHKLETGSVELPIGPNGEKGEFTYAELGLSHPFVLSGEMQTNFMIPNPEYLRLTGGNPAMAGASDASGMSGGMMDTGMMSGGGMMGSGSMMGSGGMMAGGSSGGLYGPAIDPNIPPAFPAPKYTFKVQMAWQEKPLSQRLEEKKKAEEAKQEAAEPEATESGENLAADTGEAVTR
jgi:type IV pilus assembly protein PilM